jgi:ARG and Rhodanese-Phosphatase-superfamily-associated Protein domain
MSTSQLVIESIQLGEPVEHRGVVVAPLFPRQQPRAEYLTLEEAIPLGFQIAEIDEAGVVPELLAGNPLESNVLLYDGEELLGAKQNRILNVTVLVAAASETRIPVSCVEEGRWSARSAYFDAAKHTAYPELRRRKAERLSADPLALGLAQSEVWASVHEKSSRHGVHSPTHAQADIFKQRQNDFSALRDAFSAAPGQCGALFALGPDHLCLDYVSRPEAFMRLYPKLLEGYLLDAIEGLDIEPANDERLAEFIASITCTARSRRASAALGDDIRLRGEDIVGSGLEYNDELVRLSAFSTARGSSSAATRITRPSWRR